MDTKERLGTWNAKACCEKCELRTYCFNADICSKYKASDVSDLPVTFAQLAHWAPDVILKQLQFTNEELLNCVEFCRPKSIIGVVGHAGELPCLFDPESIQREPSPPEFVAFCNEHLVPRSDTNRRTLFVLMAIDEPEQIGE